MARCRPGAGGLPRPLRGQVQPERGRVGVEVQVHAESAERSFVLVFNVLVGGLTNPPFIVKCIIAPICMSAY